MHDRYIDQLPRTGPQLGAWLATQAYALTGNRTGDRSVHRPALNSLSHISQGKSQHFILFLKDFIYLFLERVREGEREGERNTNVWLSLMRRPPLGT